ncbi:MAG: 3-oxoacyl-ACP reductase FabG [Candidatus Wallbacteria bacterium HGW-Wallbacteria-1]|jgi:3-oxoacyl-[acyl-carrier protein] reductase|uniref:3-oxoacyl-ACP reductase FabG n=1 Tax=Candidatus Wallbacteria bacterium HGW-Wallbacteria-1 TaxID=2013854 RepID=A0A2N1PQY0_9BACT|nr:MAG: 3-oxoacyl-ACP reductase FabG [Candidatus Wallbacteria bacterium HGW-Wallbacteria-1]
MRLRDKIAIITGGARGIGFAVAKRFLEDGAAVAIWDLDRESLDQACEALGHIGPRVIGMEVDVTDSGQVRDAVDRVEAELGHLDIMVNNAGITADAMLHKMDDNQWQRVIDVNLKGVFNCGREAAVRMRDRNSGVIINTSSVVGLYGNLGQSNYAATKAGVIAMTKTWAKELGRKNIRVNAVAPGYTMTEMMGTVPEKVLNMIKDKTPMNRLAEPWEIAAAFSYLASDDAAFVTGHVLSVDGGLVL